MGACAGIATRIEVPCDSCDSCDSDSDDAESVVSNDSFTGILKGAFIRAHARPGRFDQLYARGSADPLGRGAFGVVSRVVHRATGQARAAKRMSRCNTHEPSSEEAADLEIEMMRRMDHPNTVRLFHSFQDGRCVLLVMDLCEGGSLKRCLDVVGAFSEAQSALAVRDVLRAVRYMHGQGVMHRDVKPENVLLARPGKIEGNVCKLIDFGCACFFRPKEEITEFAGTAAFVAPEVLFGRYGRECDLWSIGATLYNLLSNSDAFEGSSETDVLNRVRMAVVSFARPSFEAVSQAAKAVVKGLLTKNPRSRLGCASVLGSEWMLDAVPGEEAVSPSEGPGLAELRGFRRLPALQRAALLAVACHAKDDLVKPEVFFNLDGNLDGTISLQDLRETEEGMQMSDKQLHKTLKATDLSGNGRVEYSEFLAVALNAHCFADEDACRCAFEAFDLDGDGRITLLEAERVLEQGSRGLLKPASLEALRCTWQRVNLNGDGDLELPEFCAMVRKGGVLGPLSHP